MATVGAAVCVTAACFAAVTFAAAIAAEPKATAPEKIAPDKTLNFPNSDWSGLAETGPDKKVRQCVLTAKRARAGGGGNVDTALSLIISRGSGLVFAISDGKMPPERILDDQAEAVADDHAFPAVAFTVGSTTLAFHPGNAAAALAALEKITTLRLRSDGAGVDTGPIAIDLPGDVLGWLKQCDKQFDIAIDRPTDPKAGPLPVPRPRSPEIASTDPTPAGPPGIEDKQKVSGWDASELRGFDGKIAVCFIRQHYAIKGSAHVIGTYLMVSRAKGLTMMVKDFDPQAAGGSGRAGDAEDREQAVHRLCRARARQRRDRNFPAARPGASRRARRRRRCRIRCAEDREAGISGAERHRAVAARLRAAERHRV